MLFTLLGVATASLAVASRTYSFTGQTRSGYSFELTAGILEFGRPSVSAAPSWSVTEHSWPGRAAVYRADFSAWPLWTLKTAMRLPLAVSIAAALGAWLLVVRSRRLHGPGKCPSCGYDLRGLQPGSHCPECGSPQSGAAPRRAS